MSINAQSRAATLELDPIDPTDEGASDYSGALLSDLDFAAFSTSALVRMADEVCLQMALLDNSFALAVKARAKDGAELLSVRRQQLIGFAGLAAHRLVRALDLPCTEAGALRLLELHPVLNPAAYVATETDNDLLAVRPSPAHEDGAWISLCGPDWTDALQAVVRAVDPHLDLDVDACDEGWRLRVVRHDHPAAEAPEVAVAKFSTGTDFAFESRRSLPITPV